MDLTKPRSTPRWLFVILVFSSHILCAQDKVVIPEPSIELKNNILYISYQIVDSDPSDYFDISLEVKDEQGNLIHARTLEGDIGKNVSGGRSNAIRWDLEADDVVLNAMIYVTVYADKLELKPTDFPDPTETITSDASEKRNRTLSRSSLMIQSLAFPGLGLTRYTGKPHWIKGALAYGCLGGAIVLNRMAISSYDSFLSADAAGEADAFFAQSSNQDVISEALFYSSVGIWITDLIWTFFATSSQSRGLSVINGFNLGGNIDYMTGVPQISLYYRF